VCTTWLLSVIPVFCMGISLMIVSFLLTSYYLTHYLNCFQKFEFKPAAKQYIKSYVLTYNSLMLRHIFSYTQESKKCLLSCVIKLGKIVILLTLWKVSWKYCGISAIKATLFSVLR